MKRVLMLCIAFIMLFSATAVTPLVYGATRDYNAVRPLDFGDNNDYDSDWGDSDWGGSDWGDSDYDSDWGGSDYDSDYSSSNITYNEGDWIYYVFIFGIIGLIVYSSLSKGSVKKTKIKSKYKNKNNPTNIQQKAGRNVTVPDRTAEISEIIRNRDANFSAEDMISFAKDVYVRIQYAWSDRNLDPVRILLHDNLYNQTNHQVKNKIQRGVINKIENVAVSTAYLTTYQIDKNTEFLGIYLNARLTDYEVDEKTGNVLRGNPDARYELRYLLKFVRSANARTVEGKGIKDHMCPNCGAPLEMSHSGKCEYCDSVLTSGEFDWVLSEYSSIRDDYTDKGISH